MRNWQGTAMTAQKSFRSGNHLQCTLLIWYSLKMGGCSKLQFLGTLWLTLLNNGMEGVSASSDNLISGWFCWHGVCRPLLSASKRWTIWHCLQKWCRTTSTSWRWQRCSVAADPNGRSDLLLLEKWGSSIITMAMIAVNDFRTSVNLDFWGVLVPLQQICWSLIHIYCHIL